MKTTKEKTKKGSTLALNSGALEAFKNKLRGEVFTARDDGYNDVRSIYNGMIDKKPAIIARCHNAGDVVTCVNFARENDLLLAIRSGGHNFSGLGSCDGGLVIDLSPMKGVRVDPENRTTRVDAGCVWGDVDHATNAFGLATVSGIHSGTGVGGLTLGGGHGYLSRKYGLTIDNLLEADMVLADGSFVTANDKQNEDLFWALRGGGGNFGVMTSFKFQLHPVDIIIGGPTLWPIDQAPEVMRWYRDFITKEASEDLYGFFTFMQIPPVPLFPEPLHNKMMCGIIWCNTGPKEEADNTFSPVLEVGEPAFHGVQPMPYPALQSVMDDLLPAGLQWYLKGDFVKELSDEAIEIHLEHASKAPSLRSSMHLYPINGAVHRVDAKDTAWNYRHVTWSSVIGGIDPDPANKERITKWTQDYWAALHPYSAGGAYVNFLMEEGEDRIRATYGDNYDRLVEIKTKYDPDNLFRVNQNIKPLNGQTNSY